MKLPFEHKGTTECLYKHATVQKAVKDGTMTEAEAQGQPWYLRYTADGKRRWAKMAIANKDAISAAKDFLNGRQQQPTAFAAFVAANNARKSLAIGTLAAEWIAAGLPFRKTEPRAPAAARQLNKTITRCLPWWTDKPVATITVQVMEDYAGHRSPALRSADLELSALSSLCKWAVFSGKIDRNPFEKRPTFGKVKQHCHKACPDDDETLHKLLAFLFDPITDKHHQKSLLASKLAGGTLAFCALTGLRSGEPAALLRVPALGETPKNTRLLEFGTIFPDRTGVLRMKVSRLKHGQNPFVVLHPAAVEFLSAWRAWLAKTMPDSTHLFPLGTDDQTTLNRALARASRFCKLPRCKPHAMRAYYVKVRRSQGEDDATIAGELGQTTNGQLIRSVYGDPQDLIGGQLFDWLPEDHAPAWALLARNPTNPQPTPDHERTTVGH